MVEAVHSTSKLNVFLSYSRDDLDFADQLDAALGLHDFAITMDRHGISGGEDWKRRLGALIRDADTVVFVLSPSSASSDMCGWEVVEASRLGKRILPVLCRPLEGAKPPALLADLNYIYFYATPTVPGSGFGTGQVQLLAALNTDLDWLREHTRLLQRAIEWETGGRPVNRLLSGGDIAAAQAWAARRPRAAPEPTAVQLNFIRASADEEVARSDAQRKQLDVMAAAQTEREKALRTAEDAQRRSAGWRRAVWLAVGIGFVGVGSFAVWALSERASAIAALESANAETARAESEKARAKKMLESSTNLIVTSINRGQFDTQTYGDVFSVFASGADLGEAYSMSNLGWMYSHGYGVDQDYAKAREWYEKAAALGYEGAMSNLGSLYDDGFGVPQDYVKAREWHEKAAAKGHAGAMVNLGALYEEGRGVTQDYTVARAWYEKSAAKDNADALNNIGAIYDDGHGVPQDYVKAREWYEKAAAKESGAAMKNLGLLYSSGHGVPQDYAKAREWYDKAVAKDNASAMNNLGDLYVDGHGVPQDYGKARDWYERAAGKDYATAMANLGWLFDIGRGVPQDYAKARDWYSKAATKGNASAMNNLAVLYRDGLGVPQDYGKARDLFENSAAKDYAVGMRNLGALYEGGLGVTQDYAKARNWYEKASAKGDASATRKLAKLAIHQAAAVGHHDEALKLQEKFSVEIEKTETASAGKPGAKTADELLVVAWYAIFARDYAKALAASDRALSLNTDDLAIVTNRAHALMFLGRTDEARALYLVNKGKKVASMDNKAWEAVIADDFAEFRKAALTHPLMSEIESALGLAK